MSDFSRRAFLRLMGQGTAALGAGLSVGGALSHTGTARAAAGSTAGKYQIFQKGKYLDWEKAAIEERIAVAAGKKQADMGNMADDPMLAGMMMEGREDVIRETDLLSYNNTWDPYNPLFNDREYAQKAGYPGIPAFPGFKGPSAGGSMSLTIPKNFADTWYYANDGGDYRYFNHFFAGDAFESKAGKMTFEEWTENGSDLRHFMIGGEAEMYYKNGELAATSYSQLRNAYRKIVDGSRKPTFTENMTEWTEYYPEGHYTTNEEWDYIKELWQKEHIRGGKVYWEDVNVGDEPTPTCSGPVSWMDMATWHGCMGTSPRGGGMMVSTDDATMFRDRFGIYLPETAMHYGGRNIPGSRAVFYNHTAANHVMRTVTNFIGDAGLVTRFSWYFKQLFKEMQVSRLKAGAEHLDKVPRMKGKECTVHGSEGDTIIGKAYVTNKYKNDGGCFIDLTCWGETLDGRIIQIVAASAKLPSKKG
jgi:hypothetical protein